MPRTYKYTAYLACNVYLYWSQKYSILVVDHEIHLISCEIHQISSLTI